MSEIRTVPLSREQMEFLEELGFELGRERKHHLATKVLAIALAWRGAPTLRFECDIDESAGMAEVVELHGYSKRTPCA